MAGNFENISMLMLFNVCTSQQTAEQNGFELQKFTYMWIFLSKYIESFLEICAIWKKCFSLACFIVRKHIIYITYKIFVN